jgi:hypothetical protein
MEVINDWKVCLGETFGSFKCPLGTQPTPLPINEVLRLLDVDKREVSEVRAEVKNYCHVEKCIFFTFCISKLISPYLWCGVQNILCGS